VIGWETAAVLTLLETGPVIEVGILAYIMLRFLSDENFLEMVYTFFQHNSFLCWMVMFPLDPLIFPKNLMSVQSLQFDGVYICEFYASSMIFVTISVTTSCIIIITSISSKR
jgi:hypothetical protein